MCATAQEFEVERQDDTLIVTPTGDLRELEFAQIEAGAEAILERIERALVRNVVVDFQGTDYYGSTALGVFVKLWKRVCRHGGKMAFCNLSGHENEILEITRLNGLWPICRSRAEALAAVRR
jgi:anti-anti-sigma factor